MCAPGSCPALQDLLHACWGSSHCTPCRLGHFASFQGAMLCACWEMLPFSFAPKALFPLLFEECCLN